MHLRFEGLFCRMAYGGGVEESGGGGGGASFEGAYVIISQIILLDTRYQP